MCLGPLEFSWLSLHFEVLVAFRAAKSKCSSIVADECDTFGGIYRSGAQMTCFNPASQCQKVQPDIDCCTDLIFAVGGSAAYLVLGTVFLGSMLVILPLGRQYTSHSTSHAHAGSVPCLNRRLSHLCKCFQFTRQRSFLQSFCGEGRTSANSGAGCHFNVHGEQRSFSPIPTFNRISAHS